jgi:dihydrofolate reductase
MYGGEGGSTGVDNDFMQRGFAGIGAWILGRNMFGPDRGPWANDAWRGWWGENPPYHTKVFVITHHSRPPVPMDGGTEFRFVDDIDRALREATEAAGGEDIRLGGGVSVIRQYLQRALVDEMHLAVTPVLLGSGEHLLSGLDLPALGYEVTEHVAGEKATHMVVSKRRG